MAESTNDSKPPDDQYNISVRALRPKTRNLISALLNPRKIIATDTGLPRDWQGLASLIGAQGEHMPYMRCNDDPTKKLLNAWCERDKEGSTIKRLLTCLEELDRYDIIDDAKPYLDEDIKIYQENGKALQPVNSSLDTDKYILTRDDLKRIENGLEPQKYDAFVLFADDDADFATTLIDKMENQYELKLCAKDRDLIVGVFEHESIIKLIAERCNRLVAIISPAFLDSSSNKFFCAFAQSLGLEQRQRKIIPCLYTPCKIPPELSFYFMLDYQRTGKFSNFWERLRDAIRVTSSPLKEQNIQRCASQQIHPVQESYETISTKLNMDYENSNMLKPKKEGVKFSSMINLNHPESEVVMVDQNLNPASSATSLTVTNVDTKRTKTKAGWLKKLLHNKSEKYSRTIIEEIPERHKKGFWTRHTKRKVAIAN